MSMNYDPKSHDYVLRVSQDGQFNLRVYSARPGTSFISTQNRVEIEKQFIDKAKEVLRGDARVKCIELIVSGEELDLK